MGNLTQLMSWLVEGHKSQSVRHTVCLVIRPNNEQCEVVDRVVPVACKLSHVDVFDISGST